MKRLREFLHNILNSIDDHHERWEVGMTGIAIIVAVFLYCVTQEQVRIARDALKHQQMVDSSNDRSQQLRDTLAVKQFYIETRAYLVAEPTADIVVDRKNDSLGMTWKISNVGRTPAFKVQETVNWWPVPIPPDSLKNSLMPTIFRNIGSGSPFERYSGFKFFKRELPTADSIFRALKPVYIGITIRYRDIFGTEHHSYGHVRLIVGGGGMLQSVPTDD
jgi:hypothetical protein